MTRWARGQSDPAKRAVRSALCPRVTHGTSAVCDATPRGCGSWPHAYSRALNLHPNTDRKRSAYHYSLPNLQSSNCASFAKAACPCAYRDCAPGTRQTALTDSASAFRAINSLSATGALFLALATASSLSHGRHLGRYVCPLLSCLSWPCVVGTACTLAACLQFGPASKMLLVAAQTNEGQERALRRAAVRFCGWKDCHCAVACPTRLAARACCPLPATCCLPHAPPQPSFSSRASLNACLPCLACADIVKLSRAVIGLPAARLLQTPLPVLCHVINTLCYRLFIGADIGKFVLAVLLPPLGVLTETERLNKTFWINVLLTLIGYIPGATTSMNVRST